MHHLPSESHAEKLQVLALEVAPPYGVGMKLVHCIIDTLGSLVKPFPKGLQKGVCPAHVFGWPSVGSV